MTDEPPVDPPAPITIGPARADQAPTARIVIGDEELRGAGWLVETKDPKKAGWEEKYLDHLALHGEKVKAADYAGVTIRYVAKRIREDAGFASLVEEALSRRAAVIEDQLVDHALNGVPDVYTNKRGEVKERRRHDPRLLMEVAKALLPNLRNEDRREALEGGIIVRLQIEGRETPKQLPAPSIEGDAVELDPDTSDPHGT